MFHEEKESLKKKKLQDLITRIEKEFGKDAITFGKRRVPSEEKISAIPTGALSLDLALGIGGVPRGRIVEIFGAESSGKTTLALHIMAEAQKLGGEVAFIDAEHALDPVYAGRIGVNMEDILIAQPESGEQALELAETLVRSNVIDVIVVDSVPALVPRAEIEGEMGDQHVGLQARLMSQALRKLTGIISKTQTVVIFINQIRQKIGVIYGSPEVTPGGVALKFYASVRMDIRRIENITKENRTIGIRARVKVVKNKVAPPYEKAEFDIYFGQGISRESSILEVALKENILQKSGSWYYYAKERIAQGKENAKEYLKKHPELCNKIEKEIRKKYGLFIPPYLEEGKKEEKKEVKK